MRRLDPNSRVTTFKSPERLPEIDAINRQEITSAIKFAVEQHPGSSRAKILGAALHNLKIDTSLTFHAFTILFEDCVNKCIERGDIFQVHVTSPDSNTFETFAYYPHGYKIDIEPAGVMESWESPPPITITPEKRELANSFVIMLLNINDDQVNCYVSNFFCRNCGRPVVPAHSCGRK